MQLPAEYVLQNLSKGLNRHNGQMTTHRIAGSKLITEAVPSDTLHVFME
jgi:hypothetical protein